MCNEMLEFGRLLHERSSEALDARTALSGVPRCKADIGMSARTSWPTFEADCLEAVPSPTCSPETGH